MLKILAYSAARSDFDRYYPLLKEINKSYRFNLKLIVGANHLSKKYGYTISQIKKKDFNTIVLKNKIFRDSRINIIKNLSSEILEISKIISKEKPNALILFGDRYDMLIGIAGIPYNLPIIHFYGGAVTEGAIDEQVRHSITKFSHLHLVANKKYKKRILQLGEEKWRVKTIGVPELMYLKKQTKMSIKEISKITNLNFNKPTLMSTFHPETLNIKKTEKNLKLMLKAIKRTDFQVVFSYPNADYKNSVIINIIKKFVKKNKKYKFITNASPNLFSNLMRHSKGMIGNSSSGIVESSIFKIPSISLGNRQKGKEYEKNVLFIPFDENKIYNSLKKIKTKSFLNNVKKINSGYIASKSNEDVVNFLHRSLKQKNILNKKFIDYYEKN